MVFTTKLTQ